MRVDVRRRSWSELSRSSFGVPLQKDRVELLERANRGSDAVSERLKLVESTVNQDLIDLSGKNPVYPVVGR
jgi:hypothetical protein